MKLATRRVALAAGLALAATAATAAPIMAPEPGDMAIGNPAARVTVVEYASVGCPHCAAWANTVFPAFRARFVDTGRVRFVVREMTSGEPALAAAGFITARCAGPAKYFHVIDEIFRRQASMFQPGAQPVAILQDIATGAGVDAARFNACLDDTTRLDALNARVTRHTDVDKVDTTPTFIVNGKTLVGEQTLDQLAAAIHAARTGR